jgi:hypothetical protein
VLLALPLNVGRSRGPLAAGAAHNDANDADYRRID